MNVDLTCQFSAVSDFAKKTVASFLFLYMEFHWLPFFQQEDLRFLDEVIFCQLCTVYMKTSFPFQLAGPKMQVIKQRKIKNIFLQIELGAGVSV